MATLKDIKTVKDPLSSSFIMLQYKSNTLQCLWRKSCRGKVYYTSDTFSFNYNTITEAKKDTIIRFREKIKDIDNFHESLIKKTKKENVKIFIDNR